MLTRAARIGKAWRLGRGFLVVCLVIGFRCPTTSPVAAEGPQSAELAARAGDGRGEGSGPGQGAPVCFRGVGTDSQAPYDACLVATPDSIRGGGRWCVAVPAAMLGRTRGGGAAGGTRGGAGGKWVGPLHLLTHRHNDRLTTVEVLATASWALHFRWACEDSGMARLNRSMYIS